MKIPYMVKKILGTLAVLDFLTYVPLVNHTIMVNLFMARIQRMRSINRNYKWKISKSFFCFVVPTIDDGWIKTKGN